MLSSVPSSIFVVSKWIARFSKVWRDFKINTNVICAILMEYFQHNTNDVSAPSGVGESRD